MMLLPLLTTLLLACGDKDATDSGASLDGSAVDGGASDGGAADGGAADGGSTDGGSTDGGSTDGGSTDGGTADGGSADGGTEDCPDPQTWFYDADGDGHGVELNWLEACEQPANYVESFRDCDDLDPTVNPDAIELCGDGIDQDCDGEDATCDLPASGDLSLVAWQLAPGSDEEDARHPISGGGDVSGDGVPDVLVGDSAYEASQGRAMLWFGPIDADHSLADAQLLFTEAQGDYPNMGRGTLLPGDLSDDGYGDLVVSAHRRADATAGTGGAWVIPGPISTDVDPIADGLWLGAPLGADSVGENLAGGADLTGDSVADLVLASNDDDGPIYIVPGPITAAANLEDVAVVIEQYDLQRTPGHGLVTDDLDGDGIADLVIGMPSGDSSLAAGRLRLLQGPLDGDRAATDADTMVLSSESSDRLGWRVATGDLDGDGTADVAASAIFASIDATYDGAVYGFLAPFGSATIQATDADLQVAGGTSGYYAGVGMTLVDLDGSGSPDLAITAMDASAEHGTVHLLADPSMGSHSLDDADRAWTDATTLVTNGWWLEPAGDSTGDGIDDLLVGTIVTGLGEDGHSWLLTLEGP